MAEPDPLLDPYLTEEDQETVAAVESPDIDPDASPVPELPETEIQPARMVTPGVDAVSTPSPDPIDALTSKLPTPGQGGTNVPPMQGVNPAITPVSTNETIAARQGEQDVTKARAQAEIAGENAAISQADQEDRQRAYAAFLERRAAAEKALDAKVASYEKMGVTDPRERTNMTKATLAVIFGGLGAAFRSAGGGSSTNTALATLQKGWDEDTERQKANIAAAKDNVIMARTRLSDVDAGRRLMSNEANAQLIAKYNNALKQGESQLKNLGIPQAQIDADGRIVSLRNAKTLAEAKARKEQDEHNLQQAKLDWYRAKAERLRKGGSGTGGGAKAAREARAAEKFDDDKRRRADETAVFDPETGDKIGNAPTKERANVASKRIEQLDVVRGDAERLKQHVDTEGTVAPSVPLIGNVTEASRTRQALANKLVTDVSAFQNLGAISKDDKKIIDGVIGGGTSYVLGLNSKQIDELLGALRRAKSSALKVQGIKAPSAEPGGAAPAAKAPAHAPGTVLRLKSGKTVKVRSDGGFDVVSDGRN